MSHGLAQRFREARRNLDLAVLEGFHALKHALRFGAEVEIAIAADTAAVGRLAALLAPDLAARLEQLVQSVPRDLLADLATEEHPSRVLAIARRLRVDVPPLLEPGTAPLLFLEEPTHLGNVGAVVRVAAAAGAAGVLTSGRHDPWHSVALRGSAGLHFALPVAQVEGLSPTARPIVALHPKGPPLPHGGLPGGALLAFGTERRGLSPELLARAERRFAIPMRPGVSSLNLATAVAVALYVGWDGAGRRG